ncbi:hypothetical protein NSA47_14110 [Irregularibacter muris]|uniref:Uncharacterized protein n=1 Tax=Irregularibacter muris TaxID=1796619 RepID=A0AAE3HIK1_9FIRM|nr:hypothetical protein [Irregularibacter muris]MCR1900099.1 hypothetical protein [Irregularibacter muris]
MKHEKNEEILLTDYEFKILQLSLSYLKRNIMGTPEIYSNEAKELIMILNQYIAHESELKKMNMKGALL